MSGGLFLSLLSLIQTMQLGVFKFIVKVSWEELGFFILWG